MEISERIITLREARGFSTNKLANRAGISQSYLREIEMGKKNPTVEILSYICDALNVSLSAFFAEDDATVHPVLLTEVQRLNETQQMKLAECLRAIRE